MSNCTGQACKFLEYEAYDKKFETHDIGFHGTHVAACVPESAKRELLDQLAELERKLSARQGDCPDGCQCEFVKPAKLPAWEEDKPVVLVGFGTPGGFQTNPSAFYLFAKLHHRTYPGTCKDDPTYVPRQWPSEWQKKNQDRPKKPKIDIR